MLKFAPTGLQELRLLIIKMEHVLPWVGLLSEQASYMLGQSQLFSIVETGLGRGTGSVEFIIKSYTFYYVIYTFYSEVYDKHTHIRKYTFLWEPVGKHKHKIACRELQINRYVTQLLFSSFTILTGIFIVLQVRKLAIILDCFFSLSKYLIFLLNSYLFSLV